MCSVSWANIPGGAHFYPGQITANIFQPEGSPWSQHVAP